MLLDEFMPVYDVSDAVATVVEADLATTWAALMDVDLIDVGRKRPLVAVLGALRILPDIVNHLLHGKLPPRQPEHFKLRDLTTIPLDKGGWVLLGLREQDEIALGLVGKFWRPVIEFGRVSLGGGVPGLQRARICQDDLRALRSGPRSATHAAVRRHADGHDRRRRAAMVPPVLDLRRRVGCSPAGHGLLDVTREMAGQKVHEYAS